MKFERGATAESFRGFFTGIDWNSPEKDSYSYYMACDEDTPVGMLALDPIVAGPRILSIGVTPERQNEGIGTALLDHALRDTAANYKTSEEADGCFFEATLWEGQKNYAQLYTVFTNCLFKPTEEEVSASATLEELRKKKPLNARTERNNFYPKTLEEISNKEYRGVLRQLMEKELVMNLDQEELDPKLSLFLLDGDTCQAALLFFKVTDGVIRNAFVYLDSKVKDKTLLFSLFSQALTNAEAIYPKETVVQFHGMTDSANGLLEKLFAPEEIDRFQEFLRPVETLVADTTDKENDAGGLHVITERSMKCSHCVHALGKPLECAIYELKPSAVIDGGKTCPDFKKK